MKAYIFAMLIVFVGLMVMGCPHRAPDSPLSEKEKIRIDLETAQATVNEVRINLPALVEAVNAICATDPHEWCEHVDEMEQDIRDALDASDQLITQGLALLDAGEITDAQQVTQLVISSITRMTVTYLKIAAIVSRHE